VNYGGKVLKDMEELIRLLAPHCNDRTTIDALGRMVADHRTWPKTHGLFTQIRTKSLVAERSGDRKLESQYLFEEVCAKTLYNLSMSSAPFDPDSPYWIIPNALAFARYVGVTDAQVMEVVAVNTSVKHER
jgi:hypothetical protein